MKLREELEKRGLLYQFSHEEVFDKFDKGGQTLYFGADPTADSLHLGNFVVFMQAVNYMKRGNKLILIIGGATGMIGDPGGRDSERTFLDETTLQHNVEKITIQVTQILENLKKLTGFNFEFEVINNLEFYKNLSRLDFLRQVGKYVTVNQMMNKETVKKRIEDPDKSISFTEFSYMLMQAFDYYTLFQQKNVTLQICGSDQRGNCITGIELIRKKLDKEAFVTSNPLVLDSNGKKFGKSEGNAIRLDKNKNSPYFVYQYFMNTTDQDVSRFFNLLTLLDFDTVDTIVKKHSEKPELRYGQQQLAKYVCETLFGKIESERAEKISQLMFGEIDINSIVSTLTPDDISAYQGALGGVVLSEARSILDILVDTNLATSRGDAKKLLQSGGIFLNNVKIDDLSTIVDSSNLLDGKIAFLRKGKKTYKIIISG